MHTKGLAPLLIHPNQQAILFLTAIKIIARITNDRYPLIHRFQLGNRIGQEIHMFHRNDRVLDTHHLADFIHPITARIDDIFSINITLLSMHNPAMVRVLSQTCHRVKAHDFCSGLARLASQGLG